MSKSTKIWLGIAGVLLIALGVVCICNPASTLFATAWLIGCFTLASGISKMIFTFRTQAFMPNSGSRMLSSLLLILLGIFFLANSVFVAVSLPVVFAIRVIVEGVIVAINSFDYKKYGFQYWWVLFILGLAAAILGFFGLRNPDVSATTLTTLIGIGIIAVGVAYICALCGIKIFEKKIDEFREAVKGSVKVEPEVVEPKQ